MNLFFFWMLTASALGLIKFLLLAYIMASSDYGHYVALFGVATMFGIVISFGEIEGTIKLYPRLWVVGDIAHILADSIRIALVLLKRFVLSVICFLGLALLGLLPYTTTDILLVGGLGFVSALLALVASLYRAIGSKKALQNFNLFRSALAFAFSISGGWWLGWQGAVIGDLSACIFIIFYSTYQIRQLCLLHDKDPEKLVLRQQNITGASSVGSGQLYMSNLLVSSTMLLDKAWITAALGPVMAGAYSVIALIPQIAQLTVNIVAQHVGPLVIKYAHIKHMDKSRVSALKFQFIILVLFSALLTVSVLLGRYLPVVDDFFLKYEVSNVSLLLAGALASVQIYSLIEFHLIAHDREQDVLKASSVACMLFFSLFGICTWLSLSLEWFVASSVLAKLAQVFLLRRAYIKLRIE